LDHIAEILCSGVTEQEPDARIWRPNWVRDLRNRLKGRGLLDGMTIKSWLIVIMHALQPESHTFPRYQVVLEKRHGQGPTEYIRPYAVRAVCGHSGINILDPERIATLVPEGISSCVSGIFHITEMYNLSDIFRYGLQPGGKYKFSRLDVHFMAFFPTDPRNEYMQHNNCRKLHIKRNKAKSNLVVIYSRRPFGRRTCVFAQQMVFCSWTRTCRRNTLRQSMSWNTIRSQAGGSINCFIINWLRN